MLHYFYFADNQSFGPYSKEQIIKMNLPEDTKIWDVRTEIWEEIKNIPELNSHFDKSVEKCPISQSDWYWYVNIGKTSFDLEKKLRYFKTSFWLMTASLFLMIGLMGLAYEKIYAYNNFFDFEYLLSIIGIFGYSFLLRFAVLVSALICLINFLELLYYSWKIVEPNSANVTGSKAVGYLFIPFYNLYWAYFIISSLPKELNLKAQKWGIYSAPFLSDSMIVATAILFVLFLIPIVNVIFLVPFLVVSYIYIVKVAECVHKLYRHIEVNKMKI